MGTTLVEFDPGRRDFLTLGFARSKSRGDQSPGSPNSRLLLPQLPDRKGFGITRRKVLTIMGAIAIGSVAAALLKPWDWLSREEVLDAGIIENAQKEIFKLDNYPSGLRQKTVNLWLQGETKALEYTKDNQSYLLFINPAKADPRLKNLAETNISLERRSLSTGGSALVFVLNGSYNPALAEGLSEPIKNRIQAMNFEHEAIVSLGCINGLIAAGKDLGVNFRYPSEPGPEESQQRSQLNKYKSAINLYAEAVAEVNDYIRTYPLFDKDFQGQVVFVKSANNQNMLPLVNGLVFSEAGLTFIVDQTIGQTLKEVSDLDQLAQKYPSMDDIPQSSKYLEQLQQHFRQQV